MNKINLLEMRDSLISSANRLFEEIMKVPQEIREDSKQRTGIMVLVKEARTRNLILFKVHEPSEAAQFFVVEKAVRSAVLRQPTSQNSEDEDCFEFAGSITVTPEVGIHYQVSVSGAQTHEDVAIAVALMAEVLDWKVSSVLFNIKAKGGLLPSFFQNYSHYLQPIIGY